MSTDTLEPTNPNTAAPGVEYDAPFEDYWGTQEVHRFLLPDGKQYFDIKPMDEGGKTRFQKKTNKGVRVNQRSQDAHLDLDPADERHTLIKESVVSFKIMQKGADGQWSEFPCPPEGDSRLKSSIEKLLEKFNPKVIQDLEFFIRTKNPWMQADMDIEEIDKEIDRLHELRRQKVEHDAGEGASATK